MRTQWCSYKIIFHLISIMATAATLPLRRGYEYKERHRNLFDFQKPNSNEKFNNSLGHTKMLSFTQPFPLFIRMYLYRIAVMRHCVICNTSSRSGGSVASNCILLYSHESVNKPKRHRNRKSALWKDNEHFEIVAIGI